MQFIRTKDLKPGMRLAKPIYNKMGVLLYDRDSQLTIPAINSIENFGLIGIYILEPAEPLPPLTREDLEFEQHTTIYMFKLREILDQLSTAKKPEKLPELVADIVRRYGNLNHRINFNQNLRSADDFIYKHSISTAILSAILSKKLRYDQEAQVCMVTAALLYNIGYLKVPRAILEKEDNLSQDERNLVQSALENGYDLLRPEYNEYGLPEASLKIVKHFIFSAKDAGTSNKESSILQMSAILGIADTFDQLTAMSLQRPPMSEIMAMRYLESKPNIFPKTLVNALAQCIHIAPKGASIDLSNGNKGIILAENSTDYIHPLILQLSDNKIYDLSDPAIDKRIKIIDIMKTMDNRVAIDETTLKQFVADENITKMTKRFKAHLAELKKRGKTL